MNMVAITQQVDCNNLYSERRDVLDQRWIMFLQRCGFIPLIIPNHFLTACRLIETFAALGKINGIILTGGNHLYEYGGEAPERDEVEKYLIEYAISDNIPLLGVCRGMQVVQHYFGQELTKVEGHVNHLHDVINRSGRRRLTNSYHVFGSKTSVNELTPTEKCIDGVIEAIEHTAYRLKGIMWHPERNGPFDPADINFVKSFFIRSNENIGGRNEV